MFALRGEVRVECRARAVAGASTCKVGHATDDERQRVAYKSAKTW